MRLIRSIPASLTLLKSHPSPQGLAGLFAGWAVILVVVFLHGEVDLGLLAVDRPGQCPWRRSGRPGLIWIESVVGRHVSVHWVDLGIDLRVDRREDTERQISPRRAQEWVSFVAHGRASPCFALNGCRLRVNPLADSRYQGVDVLQCLRAVGTPGCMGLPV